MKLQLLTILLTSALGGSGNVSEEIAFPDGPATELALADAAASRDALPEEGAADHQSSPCLFPGTWVALRDAGLPYVKCGSSSFRMPRQGQG